MNQIQKQRNSVQDPGKARREAERRSQQLELLKPSRMGVRVTGTVIRSKCEHNETKFGLSLKLTFSIIIEDHKAPKTIPVVKKVKGGVPQRTTMAVDFSDDRSMAGDCAASTTNSIITVASNNTNGSSNNSNGNGRDESERTHYEDVAYDPNEVDASVVNGKKLDCVIFQSLKGVIHITNTVQQIESTIREGAFVEVTNLRLEESYNPAARRNVFYSNAEQVLPCDPPRHVSAWGNRPDLSELFPERIPPPTQGNAIALLFEMALLQREIPRVNRFRAAIIQASAKAYALSSPLAFCIPSENIKTRDAKLFDGAGNVKDDASSPILSIAALRDPGSYEHGFDDFPFATVSRIKPKNVQGYALYMEVSMKTVTDDFNMGLYMNNVCRMNGNPSQDKVPNKTQFGNDNFYGIGEVPNGHVAEGMDSWMNIFRLNQPARVIFVMLPSSTIVEEGFEGFAEIDINELMSDEHLPPIGAIMGASNDGGESSSNASDNAASSVDNIAVVHNDADGHCEQRGTVATTTTAITTTTTTAPPPTFTIKNGTIVGMVCLFQSYLESNGLAIRIPQQTTTTTDDDNESNIATNLTLNLQALPDAISLLNDIDTFKMPSVNPIDVLYYPAHSETRPANSVNNYVWNPWNADPEWPIKNLRESMLGARSFQNTGHTQWDIRYLLGYLKRLPSDGRVLGDELKHSLQKVGLDLGSIMRFGTTDDFLSMSSQDSQSLDHDTLDALIPKTKGEAVYMANRLLRVIAMANLKDREERDRKDRKLSAEKAKTYKGLLQAKDKEQYKAVHNGSDVGWKFDEADVDVEVLSPLTFVPYAIRLEMQQGIGNNNSSSSSSRRGHKRKERTTETDEEETKMKKEVKVEK